MKRIMTFDAMITLLLMALPGYAFLPGLAACPDKSRKGLKYFSKNIS